MLLLEGEVGMLHMESSKRLHFKKCQGQERSGEKREGPRKERLLRGDGSHQALEVME